MNLSTRKCGCGGPRYFRRTRDGIDEWRHRSDGSPWAASASVTMLEMDIVKAIEMARARAKLEQQDDSAPVRAKEEP
jgi:hypothetical protein